ncbi:MAG: hypothetical protein IKU37_00680 [Candidatus Gastranaerophilales bacterium]|nr:hypothetical protein [Candidatus Gastranaerophilales bacterium]
MKYEFKKSKYPIFKIAFWILLFCSICSFLMIAKNNAYYLTSKNHTFILKPITVNIEFTRNVDDMVFVCFDDYCKTLKQNSPIAQKAGFSYINSASFNGNDEVFFKTKIKKTQLALPKAMKNPENKIKNIVLNIGNDIKYYDFLDIKKLENKNTLIKIDGKQNPEHYIVYTFENSGNYIGLKNHLITIMLSFVEKIKLYTLPYCWLFVSILIFLFNKDAFKISFKRKAVVLSSVILFILLFIYGISLFLPKGNNMLGECILNDIKSYSEPIEIQVITQKNKELNENLKELNITWHYVDSKGEKINKINKDDYIKNDKKTIIYFNSDSVDIGMISLLNPRVKIYETNNGAIGKIIYN